MQTKNLTSLTSTAPVIGVDRHNSPAGLDLDHRGGPGVVFSRLSRGSDDEESKGGLASGFNGNSGIGLNALNTKGTAIANSNMEAAAVLSAIAGAHAPIGAVIYRAANSNRFGGDAYRASSGAALRFWRTISASRRRLHGLTAEGTLVAFTD